MGSDGIGDLLPLSEVEVADDEFEVVLSGSPDLAVRVREAAIPLGTPATCRAANDAFGREYEMVSVELLGAG
jgi:hypothetical protein